MNLDLFVQSSNWYHPSIHMTNLPDLKLNDHLVENLQDNLRNIRNIDNLSIDDDPDIYTDDIIDDADFDEKNELTCTEQRSETANSQYSEENISISNSSVDVNESLSEKTKVNITRGKSKFYFPPDESAEGSAEYGKLFTNECMLYTLENVDCLCSTNRDTPGIRVKGKLILTNFQLVFIPNAKELDVENLEESYLSLFTHERYSSSVIPLTFIHELKASNSSHKYRALSSVLENSSTGVLRDLLVKCKNFMTKLFFFSNPAKNYSEISNFITKLLYHSNIKRVVHERFKSLIQDVTADISNSQRIHAGVQHTISQELSMKSDNSVRLEKQTRKSYMTATDLYEDLVESECQHMFTIKSGFAFITPDKFKINTNMPFCVMPKSVAESILSKRVVINEQYVLEFNSDIVVSGSNSKLSTLGKRASVLIGTSPRTSKLPEKAILMNQQPILSSTSITNPFYDSQFPIWSFSSKLTGCSLVLVPDSVSNRKEDCDIIIKNYNLLLCDANMKLKNLNEAVRDKKIKIGQTDYGEYEFFKFQVPFDHTEITKIYLKLMEICSFKSKTDYIKANETSSYFVRLHNSKWLKRVSQIISLASKIINCLQLRQRNVFLEELQSNKDCSCIITCLVKMCMDKRHRTIIGFENLIEKDWFLAGHLFNQRLSSSSSHEDSTADVEDNSNAQIAPTFLLFLDCVFQLTQQYPEEFEFNEIYLIHTWDYSCSGLSYTFSFDGIISFLNYLNNQTFLTSNTFIETSTISMQFGDGIQIPKFNNTFLNEVFQMNSKFWVNHVEKNKKLLVNSKFSLRFDSESILTPNTKIYALKFWSRCYLRWYEKFHCYKSFELDNLKCRQEDKPRVREELENQRLRRLPSIATTHTRPAPPPPIIVKNIDESSTKSDPARKNSVSSKTFVTENGIKVVTRTYQGGDIESSF